MLNNNGTLTCWQGSPACTFLCEAHKLKVDYGVNKAVHFKVILMFCTFLH